MIALSSSIDTTIIIAVHRTRKLNFSVGIKRKCVLYYLALAVGPSRA